MRRTRRFQTPPPADPIGAAKDSSLAFRLNFGFFLRQLGIFLVLDCLFIMLSVLGLTLYAENQCADVAALVERRGLPDRATVEWMESGDLTVAPLDREPQGLQFPSFIRGWEELQEGRRSLDKLRCYVVELPNDGQPYAIRADMRDIFLSLRWIIIALLVCQIFSLILNLFRNYYAIRQVLRPIQDLATTTRRLNASTARKAKQSASRELENLTDELDKINAGHLDSRIDLPATQKELRSLAQAINAMLDRVNQAYSNQMRFVSDASHELRTPIAVIQSYASLLSRWGKSDPETLDESINAIRDEAQSMERLVEQLLFLARGDNESQPVKKERLDLTALAVEVLREEEMIHQDRNFMPQWEEDGPVEVTADAGLMKQLMRILLDNSVKYSPVDSTVYLKISCSGGCARVTVQDEGMGIVPEALPHIFERFYRTDRSRARKTGGTGLGLSIAKWIVDRHGGWFEILSRVDLGTRITFVLPLEEKTEGQEETL